jgi:hypothetical protein
MSKPSIERVSESRCFEGRQFVYKHASSACACTMRFAVFLPQAAERGPVPALYWLSGLTCTEENFSVKAGAQRYAAELGLALIIPDTSPPGLKCEHVPCRGNHIVGIERRRRNVSCDDARVAGQLEPIRIQFLGNEHVVAHVQQVSRRRVDGRGFGIEQAVRIPRSEVADIRARSRRIEAHAVIKETPAVGQNLRPRDRDVLGRVVEL